MSDLTGRFIHLQHEPDETFVAWAQRINAAEDEREYGVDGERERAVEAGMIDALEAGEGDGRFDDLLLVMDPNSGTRFGGAIARILDALGPLADNLVIVDMAAEQNIVTRELPGRAFVNRVIDADMNRLIIDEFASFPDPVDVLGPLHAHRQREAFLWGERGKRAHVIDYIDLRDPFINAVIGKDEPNDQRKGFYRDFEGKRPDGSFKRRKRGKRRG